MRIKQISAILLALPLFCVTAFAAPATSSDALEIVPQGEVFVSPDFIWNEGSPGDFQVRFTITNGSDTVIPETEVRITLPDPALRFDTEAAFSGQEPPAGSLTADERELLLELTDFQVGEAYAVSAAGNAENAFGTDDAAGAGAASESANILPDSAEELRYSPGAMNISLVLRGYGEEHATALDYRIPDLVRGVKETPETVPETRTLIMLSAALTGTGMENVTADLVEAPLSHALVSMNKNNEYFLYNIHYFMEKEAGGASDRPFTILWLLPFMAAGCAMLILYFLYCIWDVQRRAKALKFDPLSKTNEKRWNSR